MSDNLSLLSKLKNKVNFKLNEAVDDPEANKYAAEQKEQKEEEKKQNTLPIKTPEQLNKEKLDKFNTDKKNREFLDKNVVPLFEKHLIHLQNKLKNKNNPTPSQNTSESFQNISESDISKIMGQEMERVGKLFENLILQDKSPEEIFKILQKDFMKTDDPTANSFNIKRILSNIWDSIQYIISIIFFPILTLIISSLISNEVVMYPAPMRLAFFIFTFIICITIKPIVFVILFYYLGKWALQYYINELTDRPKVKYIPTFYAFIPLLTNEPSSGFMKFLLSPLLYGILRSTQDNKELTTVMENYDTELHNSFPYIDKIKDQEPYKKDLAKIKINFETLHKSITPPRQSSINTKEPGTPVTNPLPKTINEAKANEKKARYNAELDRRVKNAMNKEREETKQPLQLGRENIIRETIKEQMKKENEDTTKLQSPSSSLAPSAPPSTVVAEEAETEAKAKEADAEAETEAKAKEADTEEAKEAEVEAAAGEAAVEEAKAKAKAEAEVKAKAEAEVKGVKIT